MRLYKLTDKNHQTKTPPNGVRTSLTLVAAAPELLAVLKAYNEFPDDSAERIAWLRARSATIAKAEGSQ